MPCSQQTGDTSTGKVSSAAALGFAGVFLLGLCYRQWGGEGEDEEKQRREKQYALLKRRTDEFEWSSGDDDFGVRDAAAAGASFATGGRMSPMLDETRPKQLLPYDF